MPLFGLQYVIANLFYVRILREELSVHNDSDKDVQAHIQSSHQNFECHIQYNLNSDTLIFCHCVPTYYKVNLLKVLLTLSDPSFLFVHYISLKFIYFTHFNLRIKGTCAKKKVTVKNWGIATNSYYSISINWVCF